MNPATAPRSAVTIRAVTTIEECRRVVELEKRIWKYTDAEDVVPTPILIVTAKRGGILLGGFDVAGEMLGFVYSFPSLKQGQLAHWSHMLGVVEEARDTGLGARLKLAQRDAALGMGIALIEWTFDPLQALNAHFNFVKLGVVVEEYEENIYGNSSSPLHRGTPTDRFVAEWHLTRPHVERRISAAGPLMRDASIGTARLLNPSRVEDGGLYPGDTIMTANDRRLLVEIPTGFTDMMQARPELALEWRLATRRLFQTYLPQGYRVVDFFLSHAAGRGHYLLARTD